MNSTRLLRIDSRADNSIQFTEVNSDWLILRDLAGELSLEHLPKIIPQSKFVQLGFVAQGSQIPYDSNPDSGVISLHESNYPHQVKIVQQYIASIKNEFIQPWQEYVGDQISKWILKTIEAELPNTKIYSIQKLGKFVGIMSLFPASDRVSNFVTQVGWVWIDNELSKSERVSIKNDFAQVLGRSTETLYQVGIHIRNIHSQKFFESLGFRPVCAHIHLR